MFCFFLFLEQPDRYMVPIRSLQQIQLHSLYLEMIFQSDKKKESPPYEKKFISQS